VPKAENEATRVRSELNGDTLPVAVEAIASKLGATIVFEAMDRGVSGLLVRDKESLVIGVNATHPPVRQRFSIAHEIGHLVLHRGRPMVIDHVRLNLRDENSSAATDYEEIQANAFAAELLMPKDLVLKELRNIDPSRNGSEANLVADLAQAFDVSEQAMEYRLVNLGVRRQL
jgi:Zn-dependent peptidase ImmA (M78 family)